jgi:paraquat-inducible protein A
MRILPPILFAATFCLALGVVLPLIQVERLFLFTDEPSLVGIVAGLAAEGDPLLAAVIGLFSLAFPAMKLLLLHFAAYGPRGAAPIPGWFRALSNWSMLDVVLVALVIFAAKTSGLAAAAAKPGLWFFAASAVLTAICSALLKRKDARD